MNRQRTGILNTLSCRPKQLLCGLLLALPVLAAKTGGVHDPVFDRLQFSRWASANQSRIKWSTEVPPAELSTHQRLILRVVTKIDGKELEKRRGEGELFSLLQINDSEGNIWQTHTSLNLATLDANAQRREFQITHYVFVKPGDYTLTIAACNNKDEERSVTTRRVHVERVKDDPLPMAFDGLPAVEFVPPTESTPDVWFLPDVRSRLNLLLRSGHRVQLQVLANITPSDRALGSASTLRRNMSLVIPAMKLLAGVSMTNGTVDVALLDLEKHKVPFEQASAVDLNWLGMRNAFTNNNSGMVDARTLANEWKMRSFFMDELSQRLQAPLPEDTRRVVIVLSGPAFFDDPRSVTPEIPVVRTDRQLYYIRCRTLPIRYPRRNRQSPGPVIQRPVVINTPMLPDDLEKLAMGLNGKIFDATSTEQFRRILATILGQIAQL